MPSTIPPQPDAFLPAASPRGVPRGGTGLALFRIVQAEPGIHFRALARAAGVSSAGHLRHHLDRLRREGLVAEVRDGGFSRFFITGDPGPRVRRRMARFSRPLSRRLGQLLLAGPMTRGELRRALGCADSTLGYHLRRLLEVGDLERQAEGDGTRYALSDHPLLRRAVLRSTGGHGAPGSSGAAARLPPGARGLAPRGAEAA